MNTSIRIPSKGVWSRRKQRSGIALLLVLAGVTLAAVLVVSLLFLVKSGRVVSGAYAGQVQTRVLANTALNLAIGQIRDATADTSMAETWASQPGVIRVYSNANSASSTVDNFVKGYKLYSSSLMTVSGSANEALLTQDVEQDGNPVPTTWAQEPGQYVNLNQPVNSVYPIVDPNSLPGVGSNPGTPGAANDTTTASGVQGFSDTDSSAAYPLGQNYPNLAMPVEWLYQLQDGTIVPGIYQSNGTVQVGGNITHAGTTATYEVPTSANPIVARVAFWTDDETSKVNINTASEGLYWDEPRVNTQLKASSITSQSLASSVYLSSVADYAAVNMLSTPQSPLSAGAFPAIGTDQGYAANQPAANEYNRFPGHPATTSLSAVFSELTPQQIFSILPRYSLGGVSTASSLTTRTSGAVKIAPGTTFVPYTFTGTGATSLTGGSVMGTLPWIYYQCMAPVTRGWDFFGGNNAYNPSVALNPNRLYATSGEVILQPSRAVNSPLTAAMVQQRKFFLTADSVAPELNLFGCPRVSMWPVNGLYDIQTNKNPTSASHDTTGADSHTYPYCTAYDKLTAFCSTLQPSGQAAGTEYPYYVKRKNAYDPSVDMGLNTSVFNYLHQMTSLPVPGFGGNFQTKYGADGDQILTEALDYIRCTNIFDSSLEFDVNGAPSAWVSASGAEPETVGNEFTNGVRYANAAVNAAGFPGYGQVVPLQNGTNMGMGRTFTVSQVSVHFICTGDYMEAGQGPAGGSPNSNVLTNKTLGGKLLTSVTGPAANPTSWQKRIQAILLVELATPMQGYPAIFPSIQAKVAGVGFGGTTFTVQPSTGAPYALFNVSGTGSTIYTYSNTATGSSRELANPVGNLLWNGIGACGYGSILPFIAMGYNSNIATASPVGNPGYASPFTETSTRNFHTDAFNRGAGASNGIVNVSTPFYSYPLISAPFTVTVSSEQNGSMAVTWPKNLTITLSYAPDGTSVGAAVQYQTINLDFSDNFPSTIPAPNLVKNLSREWIFAQNDITGAAPGVGVTGGRLSILGSGSSPSSGVLGCQEFIQAQNQALGASPAPTTAGGNTDVVRSLAVVDGDFRLNAAMKTVPTSRFAPVGANALTDTTTYALQTLTTPYFGTQFYPWPTNYPYGMTTSYKVDVSNPTSDGSTASATRANEGSYVKNSVGASVQMPAFCNPEYPATAFTGAKASDSGDWDNGMAAMPDGPFANMANEGNVSSTYQNDTTAGFSGYAPTIPTFDNPSLERSGIITCFSPNRQIPSSGMFGSLPTGVQRALPWQTLRFRPQSNTTSGPDYTANYSTSIPDHLFMDLFWMPVIQPYAISQPFSTAGKVNMNYQILPFTYIKRQTGLYAVLKNERMLCVPSTAVTTYKADTTAAGFGPGAPSPGAVQGSDAVAWRHMINVPATLSQFDGVFAQNQIFRTPAQICDQYLVPLNGDAPALTASSSAATVKSSMQTYWSGELLTGDNSRERPYAVIYPRLTTQSNTYRVHYWVQTLKKGISSNQAYFVDPNSTQAQSSGQTADSIRGQLRGSFLIERYLQADDSRLAAWGAANYTTPTANLNAYYKIRIVGSTDFSPQ